jgi:hypothetical protein
MLIATLTLSLYPPDNVLKTQASFLSYPYHNSAYSTSVYDHSAIIFAISYL